MPDIVRAVGLSWSDFGVSRPENTTLGSMVVMMMGPIAALAFGGINFAQNVLQQALSAVQGVM